MRWKKPKKLPKRAGLLPDDFKQPSLKDPKVLEFLVEGLDLKDGYLVSKAPEIR